MPAPPEDTRSFAARAVAVEPSGDDGVRLLVRPEIELPPLRAARFFMVKRADRLSPLIPRPFSIYRQRGDVLEFLIKVGGEGTRALAECRPGTALRLVGPAGNGWPTLEDGPPLVMLAGGIGSAPFPMAVEQLLGGTFGNVPLPAARITLIYGAARAGLLYERQAFESLGVRCLLATDDGSAGTRGNVLDVLRREIAVGSLPSDLRLFACGPERMLHAVEDYALAQGLQAWISMETMMGCGVGICNGCPVRARPSGRFGDWSNAKCCVEGPVFAVADVTLAGV